MNAFNVSVREVAREQKKVFNKVKRTKQAALVVSRDKGPQVAIIPLEDYRKLEELKAQQRQKASIDVLYELVELGKKYHTKGHKKTNALEEIDKMWQEWK